jgi:DNA-binding MurR/RpiR family transcriptional regulator
VRIEIIIAQKERRRKMQSLMENIQVFYDDFSPQQKLIADLILAKTFIPEFRTAKALSDRLGISSSTVVRFAHRLGFKGYPELSQKIHQCFFEENTPMLKIRKSLFELQASQNPMELISHYEIENLQQVEFLNPPEKVNSLISIFKKGGSILFTGARAAYSIAFYAGFLFGQLEGRFSFMNSFAY